MKKVLLLIVIASVCEKAKAQTWITIPDANFVTYLQGLIPSAMAGNQLNTSSTLVTTTTHTINCFSKSIANLFGVQYFTSLTYLDCHSNSLTILPTLPNSLQILFCENNSLTSLPALPNSFQQLWCSSNPLTSLPALPSSLITLYCYNNSLTSLPALPNSLTFLDCRQNNIACFPTFPNSIIDSNYFSIDPNPYNCLPNYIAAMSAADLAVPLCAAGNSNGCAVATGIQQFANSNEVSIYPNPASSSLQVTLSGNNANTTHPYPSKEGTTIEVYNTIGECVHRQIATSANCQKEGTIIMIDVSDLAEGVYQFIIHNSEFTINKKVVIVR